MSYRRSTFKFAPGLDLRVIDRDGDPWFVAKDVCEALSMKTEKGTGQWLVGLDTHEKQTLRISQGNARGNPNGLCINESGLYSLILKSRRPEAVEFQRWVTQQVLPTIRKTGGYMTPTLAVQAVEDPAVFMARAKAPERQVRLAPAIGRGPVAPR